MTTPLGVPNLPIGALTVATLSQQLQDQTQAAMRARAGDQMPAIFGSSTGGDILNDLSPFGIITSIWAGINSLIATADPGDIEGPEDLPPLMLDFIEGLPFIGQFVTLFQALLGLYDGEDETLLDIQSLMAPLAEFWTWVWELFTDAITGDLVDTILKPLVEFGKWLIELFTDVLSGDLVNTILKPLVEFGKWVWELFTDITSGDLVDTILKPFVEFGKWLMELFGGVPTELENIFTALQGLLNPAGTLETWLGGLPTLTADPINDLWSLLNGGAEAIDKTINDVLTSVGDFVSQLITNITGIPGALGLGDVSTWARDLLDKGLTWPDFRTLFGDVPAGILGVLPIPNISLINPELMSQGGFDTASTLAEGSGWAWDTDTHSGSSGSAKVAGDGTTRQLYSNQSVSVAEGDKLIISCWVKSTGTVGANGIVLSVVEFSGTTAGATTTIASRDSSASWVQIGNSAGTPYTVPAGVTSVRVRLAVTSAAAIGSYVWFDDVSVKKTGLLSGDWMNGIFGTVAEDIQTGVDNIVSAIQEAATSGNPIGAVKTVLETIFTTLFGPAIDFLPTLVSNPLLETAIPTLSGSKIGSGTVSADYLPLDDIGAEINPTEGSGAQLIRSASDPVAASTGRNVTPDSFFTSLSRASADVRCLTTDGTEITTAGARGDFAGAFKVTYAGWYMVELSYRINVGAVTGSLSVAPVLFKGTTLAGTTAFKVGTDIQFLWLVTTSVTPRFVQNSFIAYLDADDVVRSGADIQKVGFSDEPLGGESGTGTSGVETYFSISLLNKSYA